MAKVEIGDYVMAPEGFNDKSYLGIIEEGKKYKVIQVYELGESFNIKTDKATLFCLREGCAHLGGLNWVVTPSPKSLMKRVINFLTFKK